MSEPSVLYEVAAGVGTITLNRPDVLNAMSVEMLGALRGALEQAEHGVADGTIRAVLLTGAGRGFCSGADLADPSIKPGELDLGAFLRTHYHPIIETMRRLPAPIVAAVNGVAAGAGMSLALASDVVLAGQSASFVLVFSRIGLVPDAGATYFLPRLIGESRARALAMLADKVDADEARRIGMVWQVHPDAELAAAAGALAGRLATQPTRAFGLIKEAIGSSLGHSLSAQLEVEADAQGRAGATADFREGVAAFIEKRKPRFSGR